MKIKLSGAFTALKLGLACGALLFAACTPKEQVQEGTSLLGEAEIDIFNETGYPIVSEPITITGIFDTGGLSGGEGAVEDMEIFQNVSEKTGITIDFIEVPAVGYNEKVRLMFASNDLPDAVLSDGPEVYPNYIEMLRPLDGYIEKYMPNFAGMLEKRPNYRQKITSEDGNIYSLINIAEGRDGEIPTTLFLNKQWLDALGLAVPETTDEFYEVLKAFKEGDPNGNGKADEIPFSPLNEGWYDTSEYILNGSFMLPFRKNYLWVKEGKIEFAPLADAAGYQNFVEYFQRLYQEGLMDIESYTQDAATQTAKGNEGLLGSFLAYFDENTVGAERVNDYISLLPLRGPEGQAAWAPDTFFSPIVFFLSKNNPYPASTMRLMDLGYEPDYAYQYTYGAFGTVLEKRADGKIELLPPPEGLTIDEWRRTQAPAIYFPFARLLEDNDSFVQTSPELLRKLERMKPMVPFLAPMDLYVPEGVKFTGSENDELSVLETDVLDYFSTQYTRWITSGTNVREEWPDFVEKLQSIGVDRYVEIHQAAYDRLISQ